MLCFELYFIFHFSIESVSIFVEIDFQTSNEFDNESKFSGIAKLFFHSANRMTSSEANGLI